MVMANEQEGCQHSRSRVATNGYARKRATATDARTVPRSNLRALKAWDRCALVRAATAGALSKLLGNAYRIARWYEPETRASARTARHEPGARRSISRSTRRVWFASMVWRRWQSLCSYGEIDENPNSSTAAISLRGEKERL